MIAVVLCGGKSVRMGNDKGLILNDKSTWATIAFNKLASLQLPVYVSVNEQQASVYKDYFDKKYLIEDDVNMYIGGPVHGLLSVHQQHTTEDILLLAVDMPMMNEVVLKELLQQYQNNPGKDAFVFLNDGEYEPLCGIYSHAMLAGILKSYHEKELTKHSMKHLLDIADAVLLPMPNEWKPYFKNYNAKSDLTDL